LTTYGFDDSSRVTSIVNKNGSNTTLTTYTYYEKLDEELRAEIPLGALPGLSW
jgi:hypothetical protein